MNKQGETVFSRWLELAHNGPGVMAQCCASEQIGND